jgi:hypothetical protein
MVHCGVNTEMCLFCGSAENDTQSKDSTLANNSEIKATASVGNSKNHWNCWRWQVHFMDGILSTPAKKSLLLKIQRMDGTEWIMKWKF